MEKEIVEVTRETKDRSGLITKLYFHGGCSIPEKKIMGVYEAEVTTRRIIKSNPEVYKTTGMIRGIGKLEKIDPVRKSEFEEAISAHFKAVNYIKELYLDNP